MAAKLTPGGIWLGYRQETGWMPLRHKPESWQCPFCLKPVGRLGNLIAMMVGVKVHACNFSNTMHPQEFDVKERRGKSLSLKPEDGR